MADFIDFVRALGMSRFVIDRNTHPDFYVSCWPVAGSGHDLLGAKQEYRMPNVNPESVLVTVISNRWLPDGWHRLQDMIYYTEQQGYTVALEEVDDPSIMPTDAIGIMRACAAMLALDSGFQWCLMVDTDTLLEKDTLVRLLAHDRPIVYPLIIDLEQKYPQAPLVSPILRPNQGLKPVVWATMSCMLFNTKVFNCLDAYAWHGHDFHFSQCLAHHGHRIYVDTDTVVKVTRGASRNPIKSWEQLWKDMEKSYHQGHYEDRDRRPPPGFDPAFSPSGVVDKHGMYWASERWRHLGVNGPMQKPKQYVPLELPVERFKEMWGVEPSEITYRCDVQACGGIAVSTHCLICGGKGVSACEQYEPYLLMQCLVFCEYRKNYMAGTATEEAVEQILRYKLPQSQGELVREGRDGTENPNP